MTFLLGVLDGDKTVPMAENPFTDKTVCEIEQCTVAEKGHSKVCISKASVSKIDISKIVISKIALCNCILRYER